MNQERCVIPKELMAFLGPLERQYNDLKSKCEYLRKKHLILIEQNEWVMADETMTHFLAIDREMQGLSAIIVDAYLKHDALQRQTYKLVA